MRSSVWIFVVLCTLTALDGFAGESAPKLTTLSDASIKYRVSEKPYMVLRRAGVEAVVVDNRAVDDDVLSDHRAGYSGIASLKHAKRPENLFVSSYFDCLSSIDST